MLVIPDLINGDPKHNCITLLFLFSLQPHPASFRLTPGSVLKDHTLGRTQGTISDDWTWFGYIQGKNLIWLYTISQGLQDYLEESSNKMTLVWKHRLCVHQIWGWIWVLKHPKFWQQHENTVSTCIDRVWEDPTQFSAKYSAAWPMTMNFFGPHCSFSHASSVQPPV